MPSPFPGMDPFIESQRFEEFHSVYIVTLAELLVPLVRPNYTVDVERYIFLSSADGQRMYKPDVSLVSGEGTSQSRPDNVTVSTLEPQIVQVPAEDDEGQAFLTIRSRDQRRIITVIELLSPTNKDSHGGQKEYLTKRANYLKTAANIVEIDLLRGGTRLPSAPVLVDGEFCAFVIRHGDRAHVAGYSWSLTDRLPVIPIPLETQPDIGLDLQRAFDLVYNRRGYDYALDYDAEIDPPLDSSGLAWVTECLQAR
ncbi:MAG: DUF4058 family protein [Planctomycetaceae bacterium]|nr:DUF4058 family protein [Planctomycetaceae bacterium]